MFYGQTCLFLIFVALACGRPGTPISETPELAIVNGRIFDGTPRKIIPDGMVLIRGNRIVAVGHKEAIVLSDSIEMLDAEGGLIMPGIIDSHVHLYPAFARREELLNAWLRSGVTTLADNGSPPDSLQAIRKWTEASSKFSPRLFFAGPILTAAGGYPGTRPEPDIKIFARPIYGPNGAQELALDLIDNKHVDFIKVAVEVGFDKDYGDRGWPVPSAQELMALVEAAQARSKLVRAHVTQTRELQVVMQAGIRVVAHTPIAELPDDLLREAAAKEVIFISTANIWSTDHKLAVLSNLKRYRQFGGLVALGTDYPFQKGGEMPIREMQLLISAGFTPQETLTAATLNGARALGIEAQLGTLEVGKFADLLVVAGDPLKQVSDLRQVRVVIRNGEKIRP